MPSIYEQIGQKIRELRTEANLSQDKLAAKLGIAANTVSRWETGTYKTTPEDLDKLARVFEVPISIFFPDQTFDQQRIAALTSATGGLNETDFKEVLQYAAFRKARQALDHAKAPKKKRGGST
jgi:transcriptional regulator with XRE-family HTH domain